MLTLRMRGSRAVLQHTHKHTRTKQVRFHCTCLLLLALLLLLLPFDLGNAELVLLPCLVFLPTLLPLLLLPPRSARCCCLRRISGALLLCRLAPLCTGWLGGCLTW
jgi:hypothetical protein